MSNGIGYKNYKYFYLFLLYSAMATSVEAAAAMLQFGQSHVLAQVLLLPGATMSATLASVTWAFFGFHTYLLCKNMTLREYLKPDRNGHMYDEGLCRNISQVMGEAWMFWLLPFTGPDGTGVEWGIEEAEVPESSNEFLQSSKALSSSMDNTHRCEISEAA